jgi:hypothetical protein
VLLGGSELLKEIDRQLELLIEPLRDTLTARSCLFLVQPWRRMKYFSLLPFHLHLRWPGHLEGLPVTPLIGLVPFFESDYIIASTPLYDIGEVVRARKEARVRRIGKRSFPDDLILQDWESRAEKRVSKLGTLILPGASYVAIDQVTAEGETASGHRSVLGRMAARAGLRPFVLVPTKRGTSVKSSSPFKDMELLLVNIQSLRGLRTINSVQTILTHCASMVPTLVLAASPADVLPFLEECNPDHSRVRFLGDPPVSPRVSVTLVGRDRPSAEREFEFAVQGLDEKGSQVSDLVKLAKRAWWAVRQTLHESTVEPPEVRRFLSAHDSAMSEFSLEASMLTAAKQLLLREVTNKALQTERAKAVIDATLTAPGSKGTLVLVKDEEEARKLRVTLADEMDLPTEALEELGVFITGRASYWPDHPFSAAVAAGYFGGRTLDVLLASRAPLLRFILDPIEARVAWFQLQKIAEVLKSAEASQAETVILGIAGELSQHVAAFGDIVELSLQIIDTGRKTAADEAVRSQPSSSQNITIVFTDGSTIEVTQHARFEVVREAGKRLKTLEATELESGDQVVVPEEDSRALFSEQLLATLDQGSLADQAEKRSTWLSVVQAIFATRRPSAQAIVQGMEEQGYPVDLATVRSWLRFDSSEEASVPDRPDRFMAFASTLGISLPPETLLDLYGGIQKLRVNHRKFGRALVRAVRAAYLGRLDAVTLRKIERDWGINARQLVEGARVATVDEVVLPERIEDVAD